MVDRFVPTEPPLKRKRAHAHCQDNLIFRRRGTGPWLVAKIPQVVGQKHKHLQFYYRNG